MKLTVVALDAGRVVNPILLSKRGRLHPDVLGFEFGESAFGAVSSWSMDLRPGSRLLADFVGRGRDAGVLVTIDGSSWQWSGSMTGRSGSKVSGLSDTSLVLESRLFHPQYASTAATGETYSQAADVITQGAPTAFAVMISRNAGTEATPSRQVVETSASSGSGSTITLRGRMQTLGAQVRDRAERNGVAVRVVADGQGALHATCRGGDDLSDGPGSVIFSPSSGAKVTVTQSWSSVSSAYVGGDGEGAAREFWLDGAGSGRDRIETFADAASADAAEVAAELSSGSGTQVGFSVELEGPQVLGRRFGLDFDLGDLVSVDDEAGVRRAARVREMRCRVNGAGVSTLRLRAGERLEPLEALIKDQDERDARVRALEAR